MSDSCTQCQAYIKDKTEQCKRMASCRQGCWKFCWQHAKMYKDGRAEGQWEKGKGCTGKKLYQYSKKPGPKTGSCTSKTMIGASGKCVKRTPANLAKKKEALAERKLKGKKKPAKKQLAADLEEVFEILEEKPTVEEVVTELQDLRGNSFKAELRRIGIDPEEYAKNMYCSFDEVFDFDEMKCVPKKKSTYDVREELWQAPTPSSPPKPKRKRDSKRCDDPNQIWLDAMNMCVYKSGYLPDKRENDI